MKNTKQIYDKKEFLKLLDKCDEKAAVIDLMQRTSRPLRNDDEVIMAAVKKNGLALEFAASDLQKNKDIVVAAFEQDYKALQYADADKFKNNSEFMIWAVTKEPLALEFASPDRKNDPAIVMTAVSKNGLALEHASETQRKNVDTVTKAVQQKGLALQYASEYQDNIYVVLDAVKQNGLALQYAPVFQTNKDSVNREVVNAAVKQNGLALQYAPDFNDDSEIVKLAVENNGLALQYASEHLKQDVDTVKVAVSQNNDALKKASPELQTNKEVLKASLKEYHRVADDLKNGKTLKEAFAKTSEDLRSNSKFMLLIVKKYGIDALKYATEKLLKDKEFIVEVTNINHEALDYTKGLLKNRSLRKLGKSIKQESEVQKEEASKKAYKKATSLEKKINKTNFYATGKTTTRLKEEISKLPNPEDYGKNTESEGEGSETSL